MRIQKLKVLVDYAIDDCQRIIQNDPLVVLSEGDFEKILSDCISNRIGYHPGIAKPNDYAVHSQITHYDNESNELNARVDILLAKPVDIKPDYTHNKNFVLFRSANSFAIELKYRHYNSFACVTAAKKDIDKVVKYADDSYYYFIILLDKNVQTKNHIEDIMNYYETKKAELDEKYKRKFFCRILVKDKQNI